MAGLNPTSLPGRDSSASPEAGSLRRFSCKDFWYSSEKLLLGGGGEQAPH